jgi:hypothetical protein
MVKILKTISQTVYFFRTLPSSTQKRLFLVIVFENLSLEVLSMLLIIFKTTRLLNLKEKTLK